LRGFKVLATPRSFCRDDGPHLALLNEHDCQVDLRARENPLAATELRELIGGYDGAILGLDWCDASVIARADRLRVISRNGTGVDRIDLVAASRQGIAVTSAPGANRTAVAELTIALMLALYRDLVQVASAARQGRWPRPTGRELAGKTLGLIGLGAIGREVAVRAGAIGMHVLACDLVWPEETGGARRAELDELLRESDVISLHVPLTPDTERIIDGPRLALMKDGAVLINTARGELIDETALLAALDGGKLAGAALDVFSEEPPSGNPLLGHERVIVTPHIGANTRESAARANLLAAQNLLAVLNQEPCPHIVNPDALEVRKEPHD
jgi:D-3-phosphoglycerate dehydrogenase